MHKQCIFIHSTMFLTINDLVCRLQEGQLYTEIQVERLVQFSHASVSGVTLGMIIHHF